MPNRLLPLLLVLAAVVPRASSAEITYPPGTTLEQAWSAAPRIAPDRAADIVAERLLSVHQSGPEVDLTDEDVEAFKYLAHDPDGGVEEPAEPGHRRVVGEFSSDELTGDQALFSEALDVALSSRLGLTAARSSVPCIRERRLFLKVKDKVDYGSDIEIWGIAAFGQVVEYGVNNSDLVYGIYPFGFRLGYWDAFKCLIENGGLPDSEQELRACAKTKEWMLQGASRLTLSEMVGHAVPAVAQTSLTYLGAFLTNQAWQFRTYNQYRFAGDASWLLGPSHWPLPSRVAAFSSGGWPGINYHYLVTMVVSWYPTIVLQAAYNNPLWFRGETYTYDGHGEGNPHSLGDFYFQRNFSRWHPVLVSCP